MLTVGKIHILLSQNFPCLIWIIYSQETKKTVEQTRLNTGFLTQEQILPPAHMYCNEIQLYFSYIHVFKDVKCLFLCIATSNLES